MSIIPGILAGGSTGPSGPSGTSQALTITNPDANSGITGWTKSGATPNDWKVVFGAEAGGGNSFNAGNRSSLSVNDIVELYQDIAVPSAAEPYIDAGFADVDYTWYQDRFGAGDDPGTINMRHLDSGGSQIGSGTTAGLSAVTASPRSVSGEALTPGTRTLRMVMRAQYKSGSLVSVWTDRLTLTINY